MLTSAKDGVGLRVPDVYAEMCILDTAEGRSRIGAKNTRDTYVSTNVKSQKWQIIASARVIASISMALHC